MKKHARHGAAVVAVLIVFIAAVSAQQPDTAERYERRNVMIPMRDGVRLNTEVFIPKAAAGPLPILFRRTPYGVNANSIVAAGPDRPYFELAQDGYIFVFQDIRGRYKSEGTFVMQRAPRMKGDDKGIDESTDAFDTIDWLLKNVPNNNGRAGMLGVSYDGWTTAMALIEPHPALKAASPQASPADMYLGDDFHHNGAFRLSYGLEYVARMESTKGMQFFAFDKHDTYEWFLALGPLTTGNARYFHSKLPTWNDFVHHPNYDVFWQKQAVERFLTPPKVPTLNVAGWWDQEDFYGPLKIYETWEKKDAAHVSTIVVGPWNHGGWSNGPGDRLGPIKFGAPTAWQYREKIQRPFFAHHLKGRPLELDREFRLASPRVDSAGNGSAVPEVISFRTGENAWKAYDHWPPRQS